MPDYFASAPHQVETESGKTFESDVTLNCIGQSLPNTEFLSASWLDENNKKVKVNSYLQTPTNSKIYALGNVASTDAPPQFMPIQGQVAIVVSNITAQIASKPLKPYKYSLFAGMFMALGKQKGVVSISSKSLQYLSR